jgi:hypothetical protein
MRVLVHEVESGLKDLSISRPSERVQWGIPVPDDPSQTIYVWLDALMNYVAQAGYPWLPEKANAGRWPADVQVIGKDIIRYLPISSIKPSDKIDSIAYTGLPSSWRWASHVRASFYVMHTGH